MPVSVQFSINQLCYIILSRRSFSNISISTEPNIHTGRRQCYRRDMFCTMLAVYIQMDRTRLMGQ